ncbi:MAG: DUF4446 family protein [Patescibacteria group bacterium]
MNTKLEVAFLIFVFVFTLLGIFWALNTEKRLKRFFVGKKAKDLEDTIIFLEEEIKKLKAHAGEKDKEVMEINKKLRKSVRGLETVRFNPFPDQGSNQSFAIGLLNEDSDGVVISSLYSRERMSVFAKPIKNGNSDYELTDEERDVIEKAKINA